MITDRNIVVKKNRDKKLGQRLFSGPLYKRDIGYPFEKKGLDR
jgi:hypothetical protein